MLVSSLLQAALRKIGALEIGATTSPEKLADGLSALQSMLRAWGIADNNVFAVVKESFNLTAGKVSYTWGVGGDIATLRPNQILGAYVVDSAGMSHPVDVIPRGVYDIIANKAIESRPYDLYLNPTYPLATMYLYPTPNIVEALHIDSYKPFVEVDSFADIGDTISFPGYYEEAVIYNLAIRLAPEYVREVSSEVAIVAKASLTELKSFNASSRVTPVFIRVPAGGQYGAGYSINTDRYR